MQLVCSLQSILGAMVHLDIKLENPENEESVKYLMQYAEDERTDYPQVSSNCKHIKDT